MAPDISSCFVLTFWVISSLIQDSISVDICNYVEIPGGALPICTASTRTGSAIFIDTSMVPRNEAISCSCSVDIDGSAQSVHVGYEPLATSTSCGLRFKIGSNLFTCAEVRLKHIIESFSQLEFSKTSFDASACFILFIDYDAQSKDKRNATVTCYDENDPPHGPLMTTFRTPTDNSLNTTLETSYSSVLATTDNILHTTSRTSRTSVSVAQVTSLNVSSTSTETTSGVSDRQTNDEDEKSNSTTVIIAAAAGAVGACAILIVVVIVYCCCRQRKLKKSTSPKHGYVNTTLNTEVTDNVVYNMDFPAVKDNASVRLNNYDVTYDNATDDTYNTVDYTTDNTESNVLSSFKQEISDNNIDTYNTVDDVAGVSQKDTTNMNVSPDVALDPSYETLEDIVDNTPDANDPSENTHENNDLSDTKQEDSDITYSVVDKSRSSEKTTEGQRPRQFAVAGSGDTYAVVDKTSSL